MHADEMLVFIVASTKIPLTKFIFPLNCSCHGTTDGTTDIWSCEL